MVKLIAISVCVFVLGISAGLIFGLLNPHSDDLQAESGTQTKSPKADAKNTAPTPKPQRQAAWPQYRGGHSNQGVATGPLPQKLNKLWIYKTEGPVKSSAVLAHGRAYIGADDGKIHAINSVTGKADWTYETEGNVEAPPLVHQDRIYVGATDAVLYCLDREGKLIWKAETDAKITGSAAIVDDAEKNRTLLLVGSHAGILYAYDVNKADGKAVWTYEINDPINGGIAVAKGQAIFGGCDGQLHVVSATDGKPVRSVDVGNIIACTAALDGSEAYFGTFSNEFIRADTQTGQVNWRYQDKEFKYLSSPALTQSLVIFGGQDKQVHAVDRQTGKRTWLFKTKGRVDSSPVISGDRMVIGSYDGRVYLLETTTGKKLDEFEVGGRISGSPAVGPNLIIIGTESDEVYAFGKPTGGGP